MKDNCNIAIELFETLAGIPGHAESSIFGAIDNMQDCINILKRNPEYLNKAFLHDIHSFEGWESLEDTQSNGAHLDPYHKATVDQKQAYQIFINFFLNDVDSGEEMLVASLAKLRYGYTRSRWKGEERHNIIPTILGNIKTHEKNAFSYLAAQFFLSLDDKKIESGVGYTSQSVEVMMKLKPLKDLVKLKNIEIKRHLLSKDLSI